MDQPLVSSKSSWAAKPEVQRLGRELPGSSKLQCEYFQMTSRWMGMGFQRCLLLMWQILVQSQGRAWPAGSMLQNVDCNVAGIERSLVYLMWDQSSMQYFRRNQGPPVPYDMQQNCILPPPGLPEGMLSKTLILITIHAEHQPLFSLPI